VKVLDLPDSKILERRSNVMDQTTLEGFTIPALEGELMIVDDGATHQNPVKREK
jgi:hypothetical protein